MAQNRFYSSVAPPTTLASAALATGNISVNSVTGLPASFPFTILIDWGLSTQEAASVTAAPTGTGPYTLTVTRGIDGTTGQAHNQGAIVVHGVTAEDYNEPQVHISLGTSGTGINQVHGLANGSAVVGTIDTQTLTNKTLGATAVTGDITVTVNDAVNPLVTVTQQNATPASSNIRLIAAAAAQPVEGIRVTGDTVHRYQVDSNGKIQWGPGGATAVDTDLYRAGVGSLQTDGVFTAAQAVFSSSQAAGGLSKITNTHTAPTAPNVQWVAAAIDDVQLGSQVTGDTNYRFTIDSEGDLRWGPGNAAVDTDLYRIGVGNLATDNTLGVLAGAQVGATTPTFGGGTGGILGLTNATLAPSTTVTGGLAAYASGGLLRYANTAGLNQILVGSQIAGTATLANSTTETAIATITIPANDPVAGATYFIQGFGAISTTATPTVTWRTRWGGTAGTSLAATAAITQGATITNLPFYFQIVLMFMSTTTCIASQNLGYFTAAGTVPTINYQQGVTLSTVTTNTSNAFVFTATWSAASTLNTMTSWYSCERIS